MTLTSTMMVFQLARIPCRYSGIQRQFHPHLLNSAVLLGYWTFDENGTILNDSSGNELNEHLSDLVTHGVLAEKVGL